MKSIRFTVCILALMALCSGAWAAQVLEDGAAGETVMVLTRRLGELGYIDESVSEYDVSVMSAVADFQTANGLERTGIADIATQQMMNSEDAVTRGEFMISYAARYAGRSLSLGNSGESVTELQQKLRELDYYDYKPDGVFGDGTRMAVADYQLANGLSATGIADASTLLRVFDGESVCRDDYVLSQCCARGDTGAKVFTLQERLSDLGYYTGDNTGTYGDNTARAVTRFQRDNGITPSGVVDVITYEALFDPNAAPAPDNGALYPGDTGDRVYALQERLKALGYYNREPNGVYDTTTETAVLQFRIANSLEITSSTEGDFGMVLASDQALDSSKLPEAGGLDEAGLEKVCETARSHIGTAFADNDGLFPGFGFVRYIYACCGTAIGDVSGMVGLLNEPETALLTMDPGDIVVLGQADDETLVMRFAICTGPRTLVYLDSITGNIAEANIDQIHYVSAYVWDMGQ